MRAKIYKEIRMRARNDKYLLPIKHLRQSLSRTRFKLRGPSKSQQIPVCAEQAQTQRVKET